MPVVKLGTRRDLRLPVETVRALGLRPGAKLDVRVSKDGVLLVPLAPRTSAKPRAWSAAEWKTKEREADDDVAKGHVAEFTDLEELIGDLRSG